MSHKVDIHVGERIRARRRSLGMTQEALASAIGLTFQQVQKYERGANRVSASMLYEIAKALNTGIGHFFEGLPATEDPDAAFDESTVILQRLLALEEGVQLAATFPRLRSAAVRRKVVALVQALVDEG